MSELDVLRATRHEPVALLELNRPQQRNALSAGLRQAIVESLRELQADDAVKAVVITGAGETFCAGFDLKELSEGDAAAIFHEAQGYHHAIHTFLKPIIAAVNGPALAGGMDLASMCDLRLAVRGARFGQPQVKLGIPAAYELTRSLMSEAMARRLCLTGDQISADEALGAGYVSALYEDSETLQAEAMEWAGRAAAAMASGAMKQQFVAAQPELFR
ncbi:MAG: enoyl-CoA hydratase/isomerase family protein [Pseudomonadales bacterium]